MIERNTINYRQIGKAGIFWAIIQILSNFIFPCITIPASYFYSIPLHPNTYLVYILFFVCFLFDILIMVSVVGAFKKRIVFAYLLFSTVFLCLGIEIFGLFFKNSSTWFLSYYFLPLFWIINLTYIAILVVILLWMSNGFWNIPQRKHLKPAIFGTLFLFLAVPAVITIGIGIYPSVGSISGNIYKADDTIVSNEVHLRYFSEEAKTAFPYMEKDTLGEYKIDNLLQSDNFYIWVVDSFNNLYSDGVKNVQVKPFQETKCDFVLVSGGSISGHLTNRSGKLVERPDNLGQLTFYHDVISIYFTVDINKDGSFYKTGIMPGKYNFSSEGSVIIENSKTTVFNYQIN